MTGLLIFSIVETRHDITFAISILSELAKNLFCQNTEVVKTILQYLKGYRNKGIIHEGQEKLMFEEYSKFD